MTNYLENVCTASECVCDGGRCADYLDIMQAALFAIQQAAEVVSDLQAAADKAAQVAVKAASYNATTRAAAVSRAYDAAVTIGRVSVLVEWLHRLLSWQVWTPLDDVVSELAAELNKIKNAA